MKAFLASFTSAEGIENFKPSKTTGQYPVIGKLISGTATTLVMPRSIFDSEERKIGTTYLCTEQTVVVDGESYTNLVIVDEAGSNLISYMRELGAPINLARKDKDSSDQDVVNNPFENQDA